jgi:transcriptional regulator with XRE-family HTH domain
VDYKSQIASVLWVSKTLERVQRTLAKNLKTYRTESGLSQETLSLEAGIDRTYTSQMERGIANPSLSILTKLADVLGCNLIDLLKEKPGNIE